MENNETPHIQIKAPPAITVLLNIYLYKNIKMDLD